MWKILIRVTSFEIRTILVKHLLCGTFGKSFPLESCQYLELYLWPILRSNWKTITSAISLQVLVVLVVNYLYIVCTILVLCPFLMVSWPWPRFLTVFKVKFLASQGTIILLILWQKMYSMMKKITCWLICNQYDHYVVDSRSSYKNLDTRSISTRHQTTINSRDYFTFQPMKVVIHLVVIERLTGSNPQPSDHKNGLKCVQVRHKMKVNFGCLWVKRSRSSIWTNYPLFSRDMHLLLKYIVFT